MCPVQPTSCWGTVRIDRKQRHTEMFSALPKSQKLGMFSLHTFFFRHFCRNPTFWKSNVFRLFDIFLAENIKCRKMQIRFWDEVRGAEGARDNEVGDRRRRTRRSAHWDTCSAETFGVLWEDFPSLKLYSLHPKCEKFRLRRAYIRCNVTPKVIFSHATR